jgi:hypothetical protein
MSLLRRHHMVSYLRALLGTERPLCTASTQEESPHAAAQVRAGEEEATRAFLAQNAGALLGLAERSAAPPGELVFAFWDSVYRGQAQTLRGAAYCARRALSREEHAAARERACWQEWHALRGLESPPDEGHVLSRTLRLALQQLDPKDARLLVWTSLLGLSLGEAGARLGLSFEAAKKRLQRAAPRLRDALSSPAEAAREGEANTGRTPGHSRQRGGPRVRRAGAGPWLGRAAQRSPRDDAV